MTAFDNDRWEAERKARLERVGHRETEMTDTTPMEKAMKAAREVTEMFGREEQVVRAVLMAVRDVDPVIKDEITVGGWFEDELKYDDVWQGTIDAILAEPQP